MLMLLTIGVLAVSCEPKEETSKVVYGTIQGVVTDNLGSPIIDVDVTVQGTELSAVTGADGRYLINNVPVAKQTINFAKEGYATTTVLLTEKSFDANNKAIADAILEISGAVITGRCVDASNDNAPLAGVKVTLNGATSQTTDSEGLYRFEDLTIDNYTLVFTRTGCVDVTREVTAEQFTGNYVVTLDDVRMGGKELLPGATAEDLADVDVWHYNEYRGGKNADDYPHFDWSSDYMGTFTSWYGWWEEQNEGTTLQIRNDANEHQSNPADLEKFDSYLVGRKYITADNNVMSLKVRTHGADDANPVHFGVMVIDLASANPEAELIGDIRTYGNDRYSNPDFEFNLSKYNNKEVVIAIGIYRAQTGDYWKQLCLRRIAFAKEQPSEWGYLPGTPVAGLHEGYKMTMEMVRSTMPVTEFNAFTGISEVQPQDIDGPERYRDAYKTWRPAGHFAAWWSCMPIKKDAEPFANGGYVIKTRGGGTRVSTEEPESYFYAKFDIAEGSNKLTLNCRNFHSTHATYFKVTAITEDGTVEHLQPAADHGAQFAQAATNGSWKFTHEGGDKDNPEAYAHFKYDLAKFNGKKVVIALAVFKGDDNGDENKLSIHSITLK